MQSAVSSQQSADSILEIDASPEFDQTAKHVHADNVICDVCKAEFSRPVPKVIDDHNAVVATKCDRRCLGCADFAARLFAEIADHGKTREALASAEYKLKGFENLTATLSQHIDEIDADIIFLTGKSYKELVESNLALPSKRMEQREQ